jgi:hypothetical protein
VRDVTLPNGVAARDQRTRDKPATSAGAIITIDCDYAAGDDAVRTRPPAVSDVHVSNLRASNVKLADGEYSCYQALLILGPVAAHFNGPAGTPILPVSNVTVSDSDFGTVRNAGQPVYLHNVRGLVLKNVKINGKTINQTLSG